jgi:glycoside hydrolase-like protein
MRGRPCLVEVFGGLCLAALFFSVWASLSPTQERQTYLGFDRNQYPGDDAMKVLRKDFTFTGYWLGPPPEEKSNTWQGKREYLRSLGYGFLLLVSGRDSRELKLAKDAATKGIADAKAAAASARQEQFAAGTIVFADIEEGGRLSPNYHEYLRAWAEELRHNGFRAGAYCSGMPVDEGRGRKITTAADIHDDAALGEFTFWVYNDACPPSGGCSNTPRPAAPAKSGTSYAAIWQFAQSPRRKPYTRRCAAKYAADGNCYARSDTAHTWFLDLNAATSADPSGGAK